MQKVGSGPQIWRRNLAQILGQREQISQSITAALHVCDIASGSITDLADDRRGAVAVPSVYREFSRLCRHWPNPFSLLTPNV
jgi:hypothetical protein